MAARFHTKNEFTVLHAAFVQERRVVVGGLEGFDEPRLHPSRRLAENRAANYAPRLRDRAEVGLRVGGEDEVIALDHLPLGGADHACGEVGRHHLGQLHLDVVVLVQHAAQRDRGVGRGQSTEATWQSSGWNCW